METISMGVIIVLVVLVVGLLLLLIRTKLQYRKVSKLKDELMDEINAEYDSWIVDRAFLDNFQNSLFTKSSTNEPKINGGGDDGKGNDSDSEDNNPDNNNKQKQINRSLWTKLE